MLSSFTHRNLYSPSRILGVPKRSLTTVPKKPPDHLEIWNPTLHKSLPPPTSPSDTDLRLRDKRTPKPKHVPYSHLIAFPQDTPTVRSVHVWHLIRSLRKTEVKIQRRKKRTSKGSMKIIWDFYQRAEKEYTGLGRSLTDRAWHLLYRSQSHGLEPPWRSEIFNEGLEAGKRPLVDWKEMMEAEHEPAADWEEVMEVWEKRDAEREDTTDARVKPTAGLEDTTGRDEKCVPHRRRLQKICRDRIKAREKWKIPTIEQMFLQGKLTDALKEWEREIDHHPDYLELGVKLYALAGNADRARETMEELFELYPRSRRNISPMMHLFRVLANTDSENHRNEAWKIYQRTRNMRHGRPSLNHYDFWFNGFLEARHFRYAATVFREMIKAKVLDVSSVNETLRRFHRLYYLATDMLKSTNITLFALRVLPSSYHSHIYLNWMMTAVRFHAPNQTTLILDIMIRRGFQPQTAHYNLYLKALLRRDENYFILRAENIGWRMIEEASKQQPDRRVNKTVAVMIREDLIKKTKKKSDGVDSDAAKKLPSADASTFAIMMQHNANKDQWELVDYLARQLDASNIKPNADLLNVLIFNCTRKGQYAKAWSIYSALTTVPKGTRGVYPNGASMRYLWRNLYLALSNRDAEEISALPTPRQLLAETIDWWHRQKGRPGAGTVLLGFTTEDKTPIINLLLYCFSCAKDLAGSLVALHVLHKRFGIYPTAETARIIRSHAAWVWPEQAPKGRYRKVLYQKRLAYMETLYKTIAMARWQQMGYTHDSDERIAELDAAARGEVELDIISAFIRSPYLWGSDWAQTVEDAINEVKQEVGLPDMATGHVPTSREGAIDAVMNEVGVSHVATEDLSAFQKGSLSTHEQPFNTQKQLETLDEYDADGYS